VENSQNPMVSFFFNSQQVSYNCIWSVEANFFMNFSVQRRPCMYGAFEHKATATTEHRLCTGHVPDLYIDSVHLPGFFSWRYWITQLGNLVTIWTSVVYFSKRKDPLTPCHIIMQVCTHLDCKL
jgi:hypothetical protein